MVIIVDFAVVEIGLELIVVGAREEGIWVSWVVANMVVGVDVVFVVGFGGEMIGSDELESKNKIILVDLINICYLIW